MSVSAAPAVARSGLLPQFKIRTRIYGGFLSITLIAGILGGVGLWGANSLHDSIVEMDTLADQVQRVSVVDKALETVRRTMTRFMFDNSAASVTEMQAAQAQAKDLLTQIVAASTVPERKAVYAQYRSFNNSDSHLWIGSTWISVGFPPDWEAAHLPFDAPLVAAVASGRDAFIEDFVQQGVMPFGAVPRGERRRQQEACAGSPARHERRIVGRDRCPLSTRLHA